MDGESTEITASMADLRVLRVESSQDPDFEITDPNYCVDRLVVEVTLGLRTVDGRLNATFARATFDAFFPKAFLATTVQISREQLPETYVVQSPAIDFQGVTIHVFLDETMFMGDISEVDGSDPVARF